MRVCLRVVVSSSHPRRLHLRSSPFSLVIDASLHSNKQNGSRNAWLVGQLAIRFAPRKQPHSAHVAHSLPLTGLISGSHRRLGRTYAVYRRNFVCFTYPFALDMSLSVLDSPFYLRCHHRASRTIPRLVASHSTSCTSRPFSKSFAFGRHQSSFLMLPSLSPGSTIPGFVSFSVLSSSPSSRRILVSTLTFCI